MLEENEALIKHTFKVPKESFPKRWHSKYFPSKSTVYRRAKEEKECPTIIIYKK